MPEAASPRPDLLNYAAERIRERDAGYGDAAARVVTDIEPAIRRRATEFLESFDRFLHSRGKSFEEAIDLHLRMRQTMTEERLYFLRHGSYSSTSFAEVNQRVYANPEVMETHMYGLVLAQFLWADQVERFRFFCENLPAYAPSIARYLEVGGGHALYIREAVQAIPNAVFDLVDISGSSIELARGLCSSDRVSFHSRDIFEFGHESQYDFVTMGEVIEHVEAPLNLLRRVRQLLKPGGRSYITTPANAPMIDHIHLFRDEDEIRAMLREAGFEIESERMRFAEDVPVLKARRLKLPLMYAAFVRSA
jgi:SAM-dependent methyltransferase